MNDAFTQVGPRQISVPIPLKKPWYKGKPIVSIVVLAIIVLGCVVCELFIPKDPVYMDLSHANAAPSSEFWFGTDAMGRDIFSMIWYGGRLSLLIGFIATAISTFLAIVYGALSGISPRWLDDLMMRLLEIFLSVPSLLLIILLQALLGKPNAISIAIVIGLTSWTSIAKVVRTEVRQLRSSEYIIAARCMGAGFFHILRYHLLPNFMPSIMFMIVMNIRGAIVAESTLSFMGIGLPLEIISWGSMLSLAERSLLSGSWWIILIPGIFLIATMLCITSIGNYLQKGAGRK